MPLRELQLGAPLDAPLGTRGRGEHAADERPHHIAVVISRRAGEGIGLSIVAAQVCCVARSFNVHTLRASLAQGVGDRHLGIYVKKVVEGSPAYLVRVRGRRVIDERSFASFRRATWRRATSCSPSTAIRSINVTQEV